MRTKTVHWNYRAVRFSRQDESWAAIHEVYYDEDGLINAITENPAVVIGDNVEELKVVLDMMRAALDKPVLEDK